MSQYDPEMAIKLQNGSFWLRCFCDVTDTCVHLLSREVASPIHSEVRWGVGPLLERDTNEGSRLEQRSFTDRFKDTVIQTGLIL